MDKGVKGLLSGDMSPFLLVQMQRAFEKYYKKLDKVSQKMNEIILKQQTMNEFIQNHFQVDSLTSNAENVYERNMPNYATTLNNF